MCAIVLLSLVEPPTLLAQDCGPPATFAGAFSGEVSLCQNWDADQQQEFWFLPQGSQIIPYRWFLALEQAGSSKPFRDPEHMDALRYLPQQPTSMNRDGLPIGFTLDSADGNEDYKAISDEWLGLTCAACHTGQIEFEDDKMLIDGAPTMGDFEGLMLALVDAMQTTLNNQSKFDRFAEAVLKEYDTEKKSQLRQQLEAMTTIRQDWNELNAGDRDNYYGFARLDAIGAIFNAVVVTALGIPENRKTANAPVSYPFLWDTPQHDVVQWNGSVPNKGFGALGRNVGQVLGVFGSLELDTNQQRGVKPGHKNSVNISHLGTLEALLWELQSPVWPETILPPIDRSNETLGRAVFEEHCLGCHNEIDRTDPKRRIKAVMIPVYELNTDPGMAENFSTRQYDTGDLFLSPKNYLFDLDLFGREAGGADFLGNAVVGSIFFGLIHDSKGTLKAINAGRTDQDQESFSELLINNKPDAEKAIKISDKVRRADGELVPMAYKARPLNGIWATAPYLHNGSVRTIRQLMLPPDKRDKSFKVGSREYDPQDMGFVNEGNYLFDTSLTGNSNLGHDYGTADLEANPKKLEALIEYLKTL